MSWRVDGGSSLFLLPVTQQAGTLQFIAAVSQALTRRAQIEGRPAEAHGFEIAYVPQMMELMPNPALRNADPEALRANNPHLKDPLHPQFGEVVFIPTKSPVSAETERLVDDAVRFDREHPNDTVASDAKWQQVQEALVGDLRSQSAGQQNPGQAADAAAKQISNWAVGNERLRTASEVALTQVKNEQRSGTTTAAPNPEDKKVRDAADGYAAPPVEVTVKNPTINAVAPIITKTDQEEKTAQGNLDRDQGAVRKTQADLERLSRDMDERGASVTKLNAYRSLRSQLAAQEKQVAADQQQLNAAKAKRAAGNYVQHSEQAKADQKTAQSSAGKADKAYGDLTATLPKDMTLKQGALLKPEQVKQLDAKQQAAYTNYLQAQSAANRDQARVNASVAAANQDYAQLRVYASDPQQYGTIAQDAVESVNQKLRPLGLELRPVEATSAADARNQLNLANQMATYANAVANTAKLEVTALDVNLKLDAAQQEYDRAKKAYDDWRRAHPNLQEPGNKYEMDLARAESPLKQAKAAATQPNLDLNLAVGYQRKLEGSQAAQQTQSKLRRVQGQYDAWRDAHPAQPQSDNPHLQALNTAEHDAAIANQRAGMLDAAFVAAFAQHRAAGEGTELSKAQAQVDQAQKSVCLAPDAPVLQRLEQAKGDAKQARDAANRLTLHANGLAADFRVTLANDSVKTAQDKVDAVQRQYDSWGPEHLYAHNPHQAALTEAKDGLTRAKDGLSTAQQDQGLARYRLLMNDFHEGLPPNLQNPKTDEDKAAFAQAFDKFITEHKNQMPDEVLLQHLQATSAPRKGDKTPNSFDGEDAIADLNGQLDQEEKRIDDRGVIRDGFDWVGERFGDSRSEVRDQLKSTLGQLQDLERRKGSLSDADYHSELRTLMGDFYWKNQQLVLEEQEADERWQTAGEIGRMVVATTVGIVTTAATGGNVAAGFGAAFATYELIDAAGDIKDKVEGKDMYADGHSSIIGFTIDAIQGNTTGDRALDTLKDTAFDAASSVTVAGATSVGMRASTLAATRLGANASTLWGRGLATAAGATAGQGVNGGGQLVMQAGQLQLDGNLFTAEGGSQMLKSTKQQMVYLGTAPVSGFVAGVIPIHRIAPSASSGPKGAGTSTGTPSSPTGSSPAATTGTSGTTAATGTGAATTEANAASTGTSAASTGTGTTSAGTTGTGTGNTGSNTASAATNTGAASSSSNTATGGTNTGPNAPSSSGGSSTGSNTGGTGTATPGSPTTRLSAIGLTGQFANDAVVNFGSAELAALWAEGRHMNDSDVIAAAFGTLPGTAMNLAVRPGGIGNVPETYPKTNFKLPELNPNKIGATLIGARIAAAIMNHLTGTRIALSAMSGQEASTLGYYRSALSKLAWLTHNHAMIDVYERAVRGETDSALELLDKLVDRATKRGAKSIDDEKADDLRARIREIGEAGQRYNDAIADLGPANQEAMPSISIRNWQSPDDTMGQWVPSGLKNQPDVANILRELSEEQNGPYSGKTPEEVLRVFLQKLDSLSKQDLQNLIAANRGSDVPTGLRSRLLDTREAREAYRELYKLVRDALPPKNPKNKDLEIDHTTAEGDVGGSMSPDTLLGWIFKAGSFGFGLNLFGSWLIQRSPGPTEHPIAAWGGYMSDAVRGVPVVIVQYNYLRSLRKLSAFNAKHSYAEIKNDRQLRKTLEELEANKKFWNTWADYTSLGTAVANAFKAAEYFSQSNPVLGVLSVMQAVTSVGWVAVQQTPKWLHINPSTKRIIRYSAIGLGIAVPTIILFAKYISEQERKKGPTAWEGLVGLGEGLVNLLAKLLPEGADDTKVACATAEPESRDQPLPTLTGDPTWDPTRFSASATPGFWPNRFETVDGNNADAGTVSDIVEASLRTWLSEEQQRVALRRGGADHVVSEALQAFFRANPNFDPRLMDGVVTADAGDPDTVHNGEQIRLGPLPA